MGALDRNTRSQRNSSTSNDSQVQREIPIFSVTKPPVEIEEPLVRSCRDELMALNRCIDLSGLADETIAEALGIDKGHFSRIRKGRAHFPPKKRLKLMELCGNILPIQYESMKFGYRLEPISSADYIQRLKNENAELRMRA